MTVEEVRGALKDGHGGPFQPTSPVGLFLMDVVFDGLEFSRSEGLPSGTIERLRQSYHQELCSIRFYEYLMGNVRL